MINQSVWSGGSSNDLNAFSSRMRFLQIIQSIDSSIKVKLNLRNPLIVIPTDGDYKVFQMSCNRSKNTKIGILFTILDIRFIPSNALVGLNIKNSC